MRDTVPVSGLEPERPESKSGGLPITPHRSTERPEFTGRPGAATANHLTGGVMHAGIGGPHSSAVGLRSACGPITRHGGARPAFNLLVKVAAAPHVDTQAAMIVLAHVLPHRLWVVALQRGGTELIG